MNCIIIVYQFVQLLKTRSKFYNRTWTQGSLSRGSIFYLAQALWVIPVREFLINEDRATFGVMSESRGNSISLLLFRARFCITYILRGRSG